MNAKVPAGSRPNVEKVHTLFWLLGRLRHIPSDSVNVKSDCNWTYTNVIIIVIACSWCNCNLIAIDPIDPCLDTRL